MAGIRKNYCLSRLSGSEAITCVFQNLAKTVFVISSNSLFLNIFREKYQVIPPIVIANDPCDKIPTKVFMSKILSKN